MRKEPGHHEGRGIVLVWGWCFFDSGVEEGKELGTEFRYEYGEGGGGFEEIARVTTIHVERKNGDGSGWGLHESSVERLAGIGYMLTILFGVGSEWRIGEDGVILGELSVKLFCVRERWIRKEVVGEDGVGRVFLSKEGRVAKTRRNYGGFGTVGFGGMPCWMERESF